MAKKKKQIPKIRRTVVTLVLAILIFIPFGTPLRGQKVDCKPTDLPHVECSVMVVTRSYGYPFEMEFYTETATPEKEMNDTKWVLPFFLNLAFYILISWLIIKLFERINK